MRKNFNRAKRANMPPPRWNLADLYDGVAAAELLADREEVERLITAFREPYEGKIAWLSGAELGAAIEKYERLEMLRHKIACYLMLLESEDRDRFAETKALKDWADGMESKVMFFSREIGSMKEADLMTKLVAPELAQYAPWIAQLRAGHNHLLAEDVGQASERYKSVNTDAWRRLYADIVAGLRVEDKGELVSFEDLRQRARDEGGSLEARQRIGAVLKRESGRVALIYNVLARDLAIESGLKGHLRPDQDMHLENGLDPAMVDTMFDAVKSSFTRLSHRFYAWKAGKLGQGSIKIASLHDASPADPDEADISFSWDESRRLVLRAFGKFSPKLSRIARKFFEKGHIDAEQRERKESSPFMLSAGPGNLPFILINFEGDMDGVVSCLGHELGHGIHQVLAEKAQGMFLSNMSTDVAETASIFAEMLVFEELLRGEKNARLREDILEELVGNMLGNALQQLSYYGFERRVHAEIKNGELDAEKISDIWIETQKEYYGPSVELDEYERYYWMLVPHFFSTPFYVHSYSFAQLAVSALFQEYKKAGQQGEKAAERFMQDYIELLETGMTRNFREMFAPFGLNPELPEFWEGSLSLLDRYLNDLVRDKAPARKPPGPGL